MVFKPFFQKGHKNKHFLGKNGLFEGDFRKGKGGLEQYHWASQSPAVPLSTAIFAFGKGFPLRSGLFSMLWALK
jgi:hypothetical protein